MITKRKPYFETILFILILLLGLLYINYTWVKFEKTKSDHVLQIAKSVAATLSKENILALNAKSEDTSKPQYLDIKKKLEEVIRVNPQAKFAYLFTKQHEKIFFLVDSEPVGSKDYSPPGQEYNEAKAEDKQPFIDRREAVTASLTDRWGTWTSALIPIIDDSTGSVIAVFGMDFNSKAWRNLLILDVIKSSALVVLLLVAFFFILSIRSKNKWLSHEISERKIAEEQLKISEERYRLLSDVTIEGILIHKNGISKDVNTALSRMLGYEREEILNKSYTEFIYSEDVPIVSEHLLKDDNSPYEVRAVKKSGEIFYAELEARSIKGQGEVLKMSAVRDITRRKEAEKALFESETRMRSITDSAQDGIFILNSKGRIYYWNPAAERILGFSLSEVLDQDMTLFLEQPNYLQALYAAFPESLHAGDVANVGKTLDLEAKQKSGEEISLQLSLSAIQMNDGWHSVGILRDITDQKLTEAALIKAKQDADIANKSKSIFLANMSHEIRTPLNAIIGFSQLMNRDKQLTTLQKEYTVSIIRAGEHLLTLINEILELSKVEAGRVELNPVNVDLHALFDDICLIFKERAQSKNLQLIFEADDNLPKFVLVDETKLRQIFVNLIGNAIKFTDEGGVAVRIRVDKIDSQISHLVVEIQDSGHGISEDEINKLFKHFEQTSSGIKKGSGTGLGLALSRELSILMGGNITASSEIGKGSIFTFFVEIREGSSDACEPNSSKRVILSIDKKEEDRYRILVVDDKKENLQVAVDLLRLVGFDTAEAINGEDAVNKFKEWNPNLILMDLRMPVMDGYEATRIIKQTEKGKETPIIALTASTFEGERKKIETMGMQGYIRKPFRENDLFHTIGKILGLKYIYEDEANSPSSGITFDLERIVKDIEKVPNDILAQMQDSIAVADLSLLKTLIYGIAPDNSNLSDYLMNLAKNYDYETLQNILKKQGE